MYEKKADLGFSETNEFGPMNQDNDFKFYTDSGIWCKDKGRAPYNGVPGFEGDFQGPPRNTEVLTPGKQDTPMNKLDLVKDTVLPSGNERVFTEDDIPELEKHIATAEPTIKTDLAKGETPMFYDFKGQSITTEPLSGNDGVVVPQNHTIDQGSPVWGPLIPAQQVSPQNIPGMAENDADVANTESDITASTTSITPKLTNNVSNSITNKVTNPLNGGAAGFSGTRGTKGSRGTKSTRAELSGFVFIKHAASPASTVDTFTGSADRNEQSPWNNSGKNLTSYTKEELDKIKNSNEFKYAGPLTTATPTTFTERMFIPDTLGLANGSEFGSWDFVILPKDQKIDKDVMSDEEKSEAKKDSENI